MKKEVKLFDRFLTTHFLGLHSAEPAKWRLDTYERLFGRFLPRDKQAQILDIGCGMGHLLWWLKQKGYQNFLGVDISPEAVAFCRQKITPKVRLIKNLSTFLVNHRGCFNVVVMSDILEHFEKRELVGILENVWQSLKDGGRVLIKTQNAAALTSFYARHQDFTHQLSFTEYSLQQVLKIAGFGQVGIFGEEAGNWLKISLHRLLMRALYRFERGGLVNPTIYSFNLIAVAKK